MGKVNKNDYDVTRCGWGTCLAAALERVKGIEPSSQAWEARILPLNHTRTECNGTLTKPRLWMQAPNGLRTCEGDK
jgi:hypothetical protein